MLGCLVLAVIGYGGIAVCAQHESFASFEFAMFAIPAVGLVAGVGIIVAALRRHRSRGTCVAGVAIIATGLALEVNRIVDWAAILGDPTIVWRPYESPPTPVGFGISAPFLIAGAFTLRRDPVRRWRFRRGPTAMLIAILASASIFTFGSWFNAHIGIEDVGPVTAIPDVGEALCGLVAVLVCSMVLLDGFVDDRVPRGIAVWRRVSTRRDGRA